MTEINDIVYANRVLLDRTGAPDNLCFLTQDYMAHVHNLSANLQLNWNMPKQVSGGWRYIGYLIRLFIMGIRY